MSEFRESAPSAPAVFYRSYSRRKEDGVRENFEEAITRVINNIADIGGFTPEQRDLCLGMGHKQHTFPSGRAMWVAGTEWATKPENFFGYYNCNNVRIDEPSRFGLLMELAMCGVGTGALLEQEIVDKLPPVVNKLNVIGYIENSGTEGGQEHTEVFYDDETDCVSVTVGDSRGGWVDAYQGLIDLALGCDIYSKYGRRETTHDTLDVLLDLSQVRGPGERLKGFGGTANPIRLRTTLERVAALLAKAVGRKLTPLECCLLIDEAASAVVAGNIRRCLPGGALVHTSRGLVPIREIEVGAKVWTSRGLRRVVTKFDQGFQRILNVKTEIGRYDFRCSMDHKVAVFDDSGDGYTMVPARNLRVGDKMVTSLFLKGSRPKMGPLGRRAKLYPTTVVGFSESGSPEHTYDIEVAEVHEFFCDDRLVSNSAGMRQGSEHDEEFAVAKDNLYKQDEEGNWSVDPEREPLRMANHTRVWHHKPSYEEILASVEKQYRSGEGAIQYAPEAIARGNADLLSTPERKRTFLDLYCADSREVASCYLKGLAKLAGEPTDEKIIDHRMQRYGLNPCITAEAWVLTGEGPRQVKDLIGRQHSTYVNGELFSSTPAGFFASGVKPVLKLRTKEGQELRLTGNHKVLKVSSQTQKAQYAEWVETQTLQPGDRIKLHNHREVQPWDGKGTEEEGWLLGNLLGDGSLTVTHWSDTGLLRYWGETREVMAEQAVGLLERAVGYKRRTTEVYLNEKLQHRVVSSSGLAKLAADYGMHPGNKRVNTAIECTSHAFHCGFVRGLFDADGSVQGCQEKGVSVRLAQSSLQTLRVVQRMLGRLGVIGTIYQCRRPEGERRLPDSNREPANYWCQASHDLVISKDNLQVFAEQVGFRDPQKREKLQQLLTGYRRTPNRERFTATVESLEADGVEAVYDCTVPGPARFDANGFVVHNCAEIIGTDFMCNLSEVHLNTLVGKSLDVQRAAFYAGGLQVAALLQHHFTDERLQYSREHDPIVAVSLTGLFDFFVETIGIKWLGWMMRGRPYEEDSTFFEASEAFYLTLWRDAAKQAVLDYCEEHGLRTPNRFTAVQPAGSKSLLTGASSGWHPPKAQRFIRRITFGKSDPLVAALRDYGYKVVPAQSARDDEGNLLDDVNDPRVHEVLVEIPTEVSWANLPGADQYDLNRIPVEAQMGLYMQVQSQYSTHTTSATIEFREEEIEILSRLIHDEIALDRGYISAALLARFDAQETFPRMPFEPITKEVYDRMMAQLKAFRVTLPEDVTVLDLLRQYDHPDHELSSQDAACSSGACVAKADEDEKRGVKAVI